jgi:hypothetical protein
MSSVCEWNVNDVHSDVARCARAAVGTLRTYHVGRLDLRCGNAEMSVLFSQIRFVVGGKEQASMHRPSSFSLGAGDPVPSFPASAT